MLAKQEPWDNKSDIGSGFTLDRAQSQHRTFYGILIQMFWNNHVPPHFHALYAEDEAVINIHTLEIMRGDLPPRALALVLEWVQEHRADLLEDWELCERRQTLRKIPP